MIETSHNQNMRLPPLKSSTNRRCIHLVHFFFSCLCYRIDSKRTTATCPSLRKTLRLETTELRGYGGHSAPCVTNTSHRIYSSQHRYDNGYSKFKTCSKNRSVLAKCVLSNSRKLNKLNTMADATTVCKCHT